MTVFNEGLAGYRATLSFNNVARLVFYGGATLIVSVSLGKLPANVLVAIRLALLAPHKH